MHYVSVHACIRVCVTHNRCKISIDKLPGSVIFPSTTPVPVVPFKQRLAPAQI